MYFKTALVSVLSLLAANTAMASAVPNAAGQDRIATDPYYACNCPNNCSHSQGSSCEYYSGPSDTSDTIKGSCQYPGGGSTLQCVA